MKGRSIVGTETAIFCALKASEGGRPGGRKGVIADLARMNIPAKPAHSPYVGMWAIEVPARYEKRVEKFLYR